MFVTNPESISGEKKYYCKSRNLKKFLTEEKKIQYISKQYDEETKFITWIFIKTQDLKDALEDWKVRKENGNFYIPKIII